MVGDQVKFLCFLTLLSLAVGAKLNVSVIDKAALRKPQLSASFNGWDPDFCNDHQDMDTFPHPDSCKEYFMCWQGELWELECDEGMLFDRWDGVCDYAEFVDCFDDECPPPGSNEVRFLPSEFCEEFYICINGQPILLFCRPGQHWNKQEEFCDDPESAGCDPHAELPPDQLPNCPVGFTGELPHPHNCRWFIHCSNGNRSIQQCAHLHFFDIDQRRCLLQTVARCIKHARNRT